MLMPTSLKEKRRGFLVQLFEKSENFVIDKTERGFLIELQKFSTSIYTTITQKVGLHEGRKLSDSILPFTLLFLWRIALCLLR